MTHDAAVDLPRQGIVLPRDLPAAELLDFARLIEELGFDEIWVVEDLGFRGGIAQATAVLTVTTRVRVGIGILPAAARNVAFEAMELATLAQLYPGRLDIGIGHGMPTWLSSVGSWPERPLSYLESHVEALTALLRGERVSSARSIELHDVQLEPSSIPEVVPDVLLGVRGPRSLAASGRIAAGTILAEPSTPEYVRAALDQVASERPHRLVTYNAAAVADSDAEALAAVRPGLEWIGEPDWAPHIAPLEFAAEFAALRERSATREEFAAALPDEWVGRLALAGTPETVRARVAELGRAGVTSSAMIPIGRDPWAAVRSLARAL